MCVNNHYVYNKYVKKSILVPCGSCPECQQRKANSRSFRISNNLSSADICYFVTLTYDNKHIPYMLRSDLKKVLFSDTFRSCLDSLSYSLPVYRDGEVIDSLSFSYNDILSCVSELDYDTCKVVFNLPIIKNFGNLDAFSICYFKDFQNFFKRLRINISRYGDNFPISFFLCTEYGPSTFRSHGHALIFCPAIHSSSCRDFIIKSWSMCDKRRLARFVEVARNAASYVSTYVNRPSDFPLFLASRPIRPKHSYSLHFGAVNECFSPRALHDAISRRDVRVHFEYQGSGQFQSVVVPFPTYVANRYFPKFKGFSRTSLYKKSELFTRVATFIDAFGFENLNYSHKLLYDYFIRCFDDLDYSFDDIIAIVKRLIHCAVQYIRDGLTLVDWVFDYIDFYTIRSSNVIQDWLCAPDALIYKYDNFVDFVCGRIKRLDLNRFDFRYLLDDSSFNYNNYPFRVLDNQFYTQRFNERVKQRKVSDSIISELNFCFT